MDCRLQTKAKWCDAPESTIHSCCCCRCRREPLHSHHPHRWVMTGSHPSPSQVRCLHGSVNTTLCQSEHFPFVQTHCTSAFPTKTELGLLLIYLRVSDNAHMVQFLKLNPIQRVNFSLRSEGVNPAIGNRRSHSLSLGLHLAVLNLKAQSHNPLFSQAYCL